MRIIGLGLASGLLWGLGACGEAPKAPPESDAIEAAPEAPPGISLSDARVQLPAVSGRPGVAYFTVSQSSGPPRTIAAVSVEMAGRTEMHETLKLDGGKMDGAKMDGAKMDGAMTMKPVGSVPLESGKSVEFAPGGKHIMLFELDPKLRFADSVELTVTFGGGDKATAKARVTTVNDMEGMH